MIDKEETGEGWGRKGRGVRSEVHCAIDDTGLHCYPCFQLWSKQRQGSVLPQPDAGPWELGLPAVCTAVLYPTAHKRYICDYTQPCAEYTC